MEKTSSLQLTASLHMKNGCLEDRNFLVTFGLFSGVNLRLASGRVYHRLCDVVPPVHQK